jgi:hypothetical protein
MLNGKRMPGIADRGYFALTLAPLEDGVDYIDSGTFRSFSEAMSAATALDQANPGKGVYISESAVFTTGKSKKEGLLLVWWNKPYADILEVVPRGRGHGYYWPKRGVSRFVEYEPDPAWQDEDAEEDTEDAEENEEEEAEYVKTHCESCGKIMPLYEAVEFEYEEQVGRSSGSKRSGQSSSRRVSTKGRTSYAYGSSGSRSSGRTYYRTKTKILCQDCSKALEDDEGSYVVGIAIWICMIAAVLGAGYFIYSQLK